MNKILKSTILQKIIISIFVIITLSNFIFPIKVQASEMDLGGVLFRPIQTLVVALGDTLMWIANACSGNPMLPYISVNIHGSIISEIGNALLNYLRLQSIFWASSEIEASSISIPVMFVTPEKIFANEVPLLDINIINPNSYGGIKEDSIVYHLQDTVSSWYKSLRNLAIVGLLSVLMYIAIRIIVSSVQDKSKYKQMFMDWLIAFCLLFFMHYIMSFSITIVEVVTDAIKESSQSVVIDIDLKTILEKDDTLSKEKKQILETMVNEDGKLETDLMGKVRFMVQLGYIEDSEGDALTATGGTQQMAFTIMYCVLVIYTIMFIIIYLKRLVYIIFLTLISPLVALTYPIDKFNDSKAQGFSTWLKEYLFNLLIQPLHLLIYTIFVGTAIDLAEQYLIYPLVVIGFMLQSEKILRKLFGFSKSDTTPSVAGSAFGGALVMKGLSMIKGGAKKGVKAATKGAISGGDSNIKMADDRGKNPEIDDNAYIAGVLRKERGSNSELEKGQTAINSNEKIQENLGKEQEQAEILRKTAEEEQLSEEEKVLRHAQKEWEDYQKVQAVEEAKEQARIERELSKLDETPNFLQGAKTLAGRYIGNNAKDIMLGTVKGVGGLAGAATLGTIGVAAGIASDDFSNVFSYGAAAGAVGAGLGGKLGESAITLPSAAYRKSKEIEDVWRKGAYSKEQYERIKNREADKQFMLNKEIQKLYKDKFRGTVNGEEKYKQAMRAALKYRQHGITDNDTIIKAMKAKSKFASDNYDDARRIVSAKLAKQVNNEKDIETIQKRLEENGINKKQIEDQANILRQMKDLY